MCKLVGVQVRAFAGISDQRGQTRATSVTALTPVLPDDDAPRAILLVSGKLVSNYGLTLSRKQLMCG
jgi:hypothetical protein